MNRPPERASLAGLLFGAAFFLVGLMFLIGSWGAYLTDSAILQNGPSAEGHLEKKLFLRAADGDSDFILEYWFKTADGTLIKASRGVSKTLWDSLNEGQNLEIKYAAANPKRNFPLGAGVTSIGMTIFASAFGALFAVFGAALLWRYFRPAPAAD